MDTTESAPRSITVDRWARRRGDSSDLLKACEWAKEQAKDGYTELSFEPTDETLIFTASKPE